MPWLIVGLGNPGPAYERSYHNLGFLTIDRLAERNGGIRVSRTDSKALLGLGSIGGTEVLLAKPQTFMNLSGSSVKMLVDKYSVEIPKLIVIYDELDIPWTGLRIRPKGSAGGHHGIEDVIKRVGTQEFPRIRLGIHPGHPVRNGAEFVLSPIKNAQAQDLDELLDHAAAATESVLAEGAEKAMTKFNRRARGLTKEEE
ncbi:MAG TPA: aminoacyl-tRNA hydrolase [Bryobacteraceae bacterium]|nr:aminoacyl-tRNA hydrolase [Bryobacteraceae bacterium]